MACNQPCFKKLGLELGYYKGKEIWPRNIKEKNKGFFYTTNIFVYYGKMKVLVLIQL